MFQRQPAQIYGSQQLHLLQDIPSYDEPPFFSSLVDTVKVRIDAQVVPLNELMEAGAPIHRNGKRYTVNSRFEGVSANIYRPGNGKYLYIEGSVAKFLTGQNVVGIEDVAAGSLELIQAVLSRADIRLDVSERRRISQGRYTLTRVDLAVHCDCGSPARAGAMMVAVRNLHLGSAHNVSVYKAGSVYKNQRSSYETTKSYLKGRELEHRPMSQGVFRREDWLSAADSIVRFERSMRPKCLVPRGLAWPGAWSADVVRELLDETARDLARIDGVVPDIQKSNRLTRLSRAKLRAWSCGDLNIFNEGATSEATKRAERKAIFDITGIDVNLPLTAEQQATLLVPLRELFAAGFGFADHEHIWNQLTGRGRPRRWV